MSNIDKIYEIMKTAPFVFPNGEDLQLFDQIIYSSNDDIINNQEKICEIMPALIDSIRENYYFMNMRTDKKRDDRLKEISKLRNINQPSDFTYYADEMDFDGYPK